MQCNDVENNNNDININNSQDFVPNILLKDSFIFGEKQKPFEGKHKLSYSTIDGRNQIDLQAQ